MSALPPIPVTVLTGFLGSGKTTIILSLLPQLPPEYKVVLLKNEYGDVEVDSQLAKQSSLAAVSEILNGCMCCVLVGQMKTALLEIEEKYRPDRIIIESSGSAFPATLAFQIRELEKETSNFKLDAIVTVIDAENFTGYEDTSVTAKMQAQYSDMILVNKSELVSERQLDIVMDHLYTLNELTPKLLCKGKGGVAPDLIFGLDSKLFSTRPPNGEVGEHFNEVETATIRRGSPAPATNRHLCPENCSANHQHMPVSANKQALTKTGDSPVDLHLEQELVEGALRKLPKESVYRVKGFLRLSGDTFILNWAFGRVGWTLLPAADVLQDGTDILLTVMGEPGEVRKWANRLALSFEATVSI